MTNFYSTIKKTVAYATILAATATLAISCNKPNDNVEPPASGSDITVSIPTLAELTGGWGADSYLWDIHEGKSIAYLMNESGDDFQRDENDKIISITLKEYCEKYAADYNADSKNTIKGTPDDFALHTYEDTYLFTNINVMSDKLVVYSGQSIPEAGTMAVLCVSGTYTFDALTGVFTVNDLAIESDPRTLEVKVWKETDKEGNSYTYFRYSDYDMILTPTYDKTKQYYVYAPMIYRTIPADPFIPSDKAPAATRNIRLVK